LVITALLLAFRQLGDPRVRRVLWFGFGLALAAVLGLAVVVGYALDSLDPANATWLHDIILGLGDPWGPRIASALHGLMVVLGEVGVFWISALLYPGVAAALSGLLLDDVVAAVEQRHYPALPPPRLSPLSEQLYGLLRLLGKVVALNLLVLPLYLIPGLNLVLFYALNGYILGRENFEQVALRRLDLSEARRLRQRYRWRVLAAGVIITFLSSIPLVNLIAPVIAIAFMVHVFHDLNAGLRPVRGP